MKIPFIKNLKKPQKPAEVLVLQLSNTPNPPNPDMGKLPTNEKGISPDLLKTDMEKLPPVPPPVPPPAPPPDSTGTKHASVK